MRKFVLLKNRFVFHEINIICLSHAEVKATYLGYLKVDLKSILGPWTLCNKPKIITSSFQRTMHTSFFFFFFTSCSVIPGYYAKTEIIIHIIFIV